jgi:hypothetical protein
MNEPEDLHRKLDAIIAALERIEAAQHTCSYTAHPVRIPLVGYHDSSCHSPAVLRKGEFWYCERHAKEAK